MLTKIKNIMSETRVDTNETSSTLTHAKKKQIEKVPGIMFLTFESISYAFVIEAIMELGI